jgi:hypothetical protein
MMSYKELAHAFELTLFALIYDSILRSRYLAEKQVGGIVGQ